MGLVCRSHYYMRGEGVSPFGGALGIQGLGIQIVSVCTIAPPPPPPKDNHPQLRRGDQSQDCTPHPVKKVGFCMSSVAVSLVCQSRYYERQRCFTFWQRTWILRRRTRDTECFCFCPLLIAGLLPWCTFVSWFLLVLSG